MLVTGSAREGAGALGAGANVADVSARAMEIGGDEANMVTPRAMIETRRTLRVMAI